MLVKKRNFCWLFEHRNQLRYIENQEWRHKKAMNHIINLANSMFAIAGHFLESVKAARYSAVDR